MPASFPQYVTEAITGLLPDLPGLKLHKEGLEAKHPVVFMPGIVTGGLELLEGHQCAEGLFRKRLWGGTFSEVYRRPLYWIEHLSLDNETGLDPPGIRIRPVSGLVAADYFAAGYFVWAVLIANLARIGYEEKNMYMAAYDWRLSFQNNEARGWRLLLFLKEGTYVMKLAMLVKLSPTTSSPKILDRIHMFHTLPICSVTNNITVCVRILIKLS